MKISVARPIVAIILLLSAASVAAVRAKAPDGIALNLSDHGVVCDGVADDSSAINAALASFRAEFKSPFAVRGRIIFPPRDCRVTHSINLTGLKSKSLTVEGAGSRLIGATGGKPVIDALGTEYLRIRDLTIVGTPEHSPDIGLQIGRSGETSTDSSDNINLDSVAITGTFLFAALYNLNAETSTFTHLIVVNENSDEKSFAVVLDGMNHFAAHSQFISVMQPVDKPQSFNENIFINCDIRHNGPGTPLWIAHTSRLAFLRSYIAAVHGQNGVVLYSAAANDVSTQLAVDAHFETNALKHVFLLAGENATPIIRGLKYIDQYPGATRSIFATSALQKVGIQNVDISVASMPVGAVVFEQPDNWTLSGKVYIGTKASWNLPETNFEGLLDLGGDVQFFGKVVGKPSRSSPRN